VIVGHNQRIAWGVTNLHFDVQDLYIENFDAATGRYLYRGQWEQARQEREIIPVKGAPAVEMPLWITRHGPIFVNDAKEHLALRWAAAEPGSFQFPFPELNRAGNWQEFTRALARYPGPAQNFVYADVDGNIGYHATGLLPIRKGYTGDVPVDGSSGENEWQGFIPFDRLPAFYNPPAGVIVTANQNPFPPDYAYAVNGNFASHYRSRQIRNLLMARNGWRAEDMLTVQKDVYSSFFQYLAQAIVQATHGRHKAQPGELAQAGNRPAIAARLEWPDGQGRGRAADRHAGLRALESVGGAKRFTVGGRQIQISDGAGGDRDAAAHAARWLVCRLGRNSPARRRAGLGGWRRKQGRDPSHWVYGKYEPLLLANAVGRHLPLVAGLFDIGPVEMSGSPTTVKQYTDELGPSMRLDADLADWDRSLLEGHYGPVRPGSVAALQGPVGTVLQRRKLSDAISESGS
jgi:penicillin amidase